MKQTRDPLLEGALKAKGIYSVEKIKACFKKYNMIIYTQQGIFDTTKYNLCDVHTGTPLATTQVVATGNTNTLILAYNPVEAKTIANANLLNKSYRYVEIAEPTIEKVIIKSFRNFLPNQTPITK